MTTHDYDRLVRELEPAAMRRLRTKHRTLTDHHDDIFQEAMIRLVARLEAGEMDDPTGMLLTIIDRKAIDRARANDRRRDLETPVGGLTELAEAAEQGTFVPPLPPPDTGRNIFAREFDTAVRALPTGEREAFIAIELRGMTVRSYAELTMLPKSTVADRLAEARAKIQEGVTP